MHKAFFFFLYVLLHAGGNELDLMESMCQVQQDLQRYQQSKNSSSEWLNMKRMFTTMLFVQSDACVCCFYTAIRQRNI